MQLKTNTVHGIQILRHLYKQQGEDRVINIAKAVGITSPLATRIMARLRPGGYVTAAPGQRGYCTLGRPAAEISFYDVVVALEGESCTCHCMESNRECERRRQCKTYKFLQTLQSNMIKAMQGTSIADLV